MPNKPLQSVLDKPANIINKNTSIILQQFNKCQLVLHLPQHGTSNPNKSSQKIMIINAAKWIQGKLQYEKFLFVYSYETMSNIWNVEREHHVKSTTAFSSGMTKSTGSWGIVPSSGSSIILGVWLMKMPSMARILSSFLM